MRISDCHEKLDDTGQGKCSVPMWMHGIPAGFCDKPAFGKPVPGKTYRSSSGEEMRFDGKYNGYVPALACPAHGGPNEQVIEKGKQ